MFHSQPLCTHQEAFYIKKCLRSNMQKAYSLWVFMADTKSTLSYSSNLHFSVFQNRPNRGALMCWKICSKKFKNKKKGWKWCMPDKKGQHWCYMPDKCNIFENESTSISDWYCHHRYDNYSKITIKYNRAAIWANSPRPRLELIWDQMNIRAIVCHMISALHMLMYFALT